MDLFDPTRICSLGGKDMLLLLLMTFLVLFFLSTNDKTLKCFQSITRKFKMNGFMITKIRSDHGGGFENEQLENF